MNLQIQVGRNKNNNYKLQMKNKIPPINYPTKFLEILGDCHTTKLKIDSILMNNAEDQTIKQDVRKYDFFLSRTLPYNSALIFKLADSKICRWCFSNNIGEYKFFSFNNFII